MGACPTRRSSSVDVGTQTDVEFVRIFQDIEYNLARVEALAATVGSQPAADAGPLRGREPSSGSGGQFPVRFPVLPGRFRSSVSPDRGEDGRGNTKRPRHRYLEHSGSSTSS